MEKEIFAWVGWDQQDALSFIFYNCTFVKDFGPWKTGYKVKVMGVDYGKGIIEEYSEDGTDAVAKAKISITLKEN